MGVGLLAGLLLFGGNDNDNSSATISATTATTTGTTAATDTATSTAPSTTTTTATASTPTNVPSTPNPTVPGCIDLWNQPNNRGDQVFLVNLASQQPVRVHVGATSDVPPKCLVTVVANNGDAYVFPAAAGAAYPYAQAPGKSDASTLPAAQKTSNALDQSDGTLKAR